MRIADDRTVLTFRQGEAVRQPLPFTRPRCPGCQELMRCVRAATILKRTPALGPVWEFTCGRGTTENCHGGILKLDQRGAPVVILRATPPIPENRTCQCGERIVTVKRWFHRRLGKRLQRVRCVDYRKALKDHHVSEVRDLQEKRVKLTYRPLDPGWRPRCGDWRAADGRLPRGCGAPLVKGSNSITQAKVDTYYCNKRGCRLRWKSFHWLRRPRKPFVADRQHRLRQEVREGRRPQHCERPMYLKRRVRDLHSYICQKCKVTKYWNEHNEEVEVRRATFPRLKIQRPRCSVCGHGLSVIHTYVRKRPRPTTVYFEACQQKRCPNSTRPARPYDAQGRLVEVSDRHQPMPWEREGQERLDCQTCGSPMTRGGTYTEGATGLRLYELRCTTAGCKAEARRRFFDDTGGERFPPFQSLVRIPRYRRLSENRRAEPCVLCPRPRDLPSKYCEEHRKDLTSYARYHRQRKTEEKIRTACQRGGPALRDIRRRSGLTQADMARIVGVSAASVSQWEARNQRPRKQVAEQLFNCLAKRLVAGARRRPERTASVVAAR